ncbi:MAG TPA: zinc dependent phospholipase C family protein [Anaerolineae bacterium]
MPTPVQHLVLADVILSHPSLPADVRPHLRAERAAFLFGNTAPDVQVVSGQSREATHFYTVPLTSDRPAHEALFAAHPDLARPDRLSPAHAAFLAGYISHLLLDVIWVRDIFQPVFGLDAGWSSFHDRLFLHNVLRAWCDRNDQARLAPETGDVLSQAAPNRWLPFTGDEHLCAWRDFLVEQLAPGAAIRTVEVFAQRSQIDPGTFERVLASEAEMENRIFSHIPRSAIDDLYVRGLAQSCQIIAWYFGPSLR